MPTDDGLGLNDVHYWAPVMPDLREQNPEAPISSGKLGPRTSLLEHCEPLAQDQILQGEIVPGTERRSRRSEKNPEPVEHTSKANWAAQKNAIESSQTDIG